MADVWRPRANRSQRRNRALGTIDGRLIQASRVPQNSDLRRPKDDLRNIQFNSGTQISPDERSPAYIVTADGIIVGVSLTTRVGSVTTEVYINNWRRVTLRYSGVGNFVETEALDLGVEIGDAITVAYVSPGGSAESAVTTVSLLED